MFLITSIEKKAGVFILVLQQLSTVYDIADGQTQGQTLQGQTHLNIQIYSAYTHTFSTNLNNLNTVTKRLAAFQVSIFSVFIEVKTSILILIWKTSLIHYSNNNIFLQQHISICAWFHSSSIIFFKIQISIWSWLSQVVSSVLTTSGPAFYSTSKQPTFMKYYNLLQMSGLG